MAAKFVDGEFYGFRTKDFGLQITKKLFLQFIAPDKFVPSATRIIELAGKSVGRLTTTLRPDCLFIDELHIVPEYQRHGIGRWAIEQVLREAAEMSIPLKLTVLIVNREAKRLYLKMGFTVIAEKDHRFHMEYAARRP